MKSLNYSSITAMIRRVHEAKRRSDETGIPARELLDQDRELRKKLLAERIEREERRKFLRTAGGLGLGAGMLSASPMAFANNGGGNDNQPRVAVVGGGTGGLRAAHRLMQFGIPSTVYEAREDRVGGRMYSSVGQGRGDTDSIRILNLIIILPRLGYSNGAVNSFPPNTPRSVTSPISSVSNSKTPTSSASAMRRHT